MNALMVHSMFANPNFHILCYQSYSVLISFQSFQHVSCHYNRILSRKGSKETTDDDDAHSLGLKPVFMTETRVRKIHLRRGREENSERERERFREGERGENQGKNVWRHKIRIRMTGKGRQKDSKL